MKGRLGTEFNAFLHASVNEACDGASLSVLSALARSDVDPWHEAAELARMPREAASQRLTKLLAALPGRSLDSAAIADRLVKLLPFGNSSSDVSRGQKIQNDPALGYQKIIEIVMINTVMIASLIVAQWVLAALQPAHQRG